MDTSLSPVPLAANPSHPGARAILFGLAALFLLIVTGFVWRTGMYWLLGVFLIMAGVFFRKGLKRLFFVLAFFMPFLQGGPRSDLYMVAPLLEVILLVFFLLWFLETVRGRAVLPGLSSQHMPWLPFFGVAVVSAVVACAARVQAMGLPADGFELSAILFQHSMLGPFYPARALYSFLEMFLLFQYVRSNLERQDIEKLARTVVASACLVNLIGLIVYFTVDLSQYFQGVNRATSVFSGPNQFATCLLMGLPLSAALLWTARDRWSRGFAVFSLVTGLPVLYFTRSQGAWLAAAAVPLLLVLFLPKADAVSIGRKRWLAVLALGGVGLATAGYFVATRTAEQLNALTDGRYFLFLAGLEMVRASPLVGVGLGNFYQLLGDFYPSGIVGRAQHEHAHNMYLQVLAELGLVGFVLLLWPIWMLLRRAFSGALQQGLTLGLLAAVLGVLLHSLTDYTLLIISTAMMFSVVMGMLAVLTEPSPASSAPG